jgi:peptide deformylase
VTLKITQLGRPVLRKKARPVAHPVSRSTWTLIQAMIRTMRKARGVGIAAPQVDKSLRLFIVAPEPSRRYPKSPSIPPIAMINPQLTAVSRTMNTDWEGCLSIPGIRGRVPRYNQITIEFTDVAGRRREGVLKGFVARIFQHELDHIDGKVFLDRVQDTRTLMTEAEYLKIMKIRR